MFRSIIFYDNLTDYLVGPWKLYAVIGVSLIVASILIFIFPELLAYLVGIFLLFNGALFLGLALKFRKLRSAYNQWVQEFWEP